MTRTAILTALFSMVSFFSVAEATSPKERHAYLVAYHFNDDFFGAEVKGVWVHTGVAVDQSSDGDTQTSWLDVQDLPLEKVDKHFFARAQLGAVIRQRIEGNPRVMVQYRIQLGNGEWQETPAHEVDSAAPAIFAPTRGSSGQESFKALKLAQDTRLVELKDHPSTEVLEDLYTRYAN